LKGECGGVFVGRTVAIGIQNFNEIIEKEYFYVDKTHFIREWWDNGDSATLITRPRRFGKTLTMSMVEQFFSVEYAGRGDLFEGLNIWQEERYRKLQGTYPVISLSFANVKEKTYRGMREKISQLLVNLYTKYDFLLEGDILKERDKEYFRRVSVNMSDSDASLTLYMLSDYLQRYYGKKVIILLDEYDTPMHEAYVNGYWEELVAFSRNLFNAAFKTNPFLERAIMTGITRVSKESIFSDLNHLKVVTTTCNDYADCFGFTEGEVFAAMDEFGYTEKELVKHWYDGFVFGDKRDIYNPWSILNFLDTGNVKTYWANTSSNSLVSKLIRESDKSVKTAMEDLLAGKVIKTQMDEQVVFSQLNTRTGSVWSFLLASGYLKAVNYFFDPVRGREEYELALTNKEVQFMFEYMIEGWFSDFVPAYNEFIRALLQDDLEAMNEYMNRVSLETFSFFDTGKRQSEYSEPERFYHGFVLGLMVDLKDRYVITSNRESGFGRYDIILEPLSQKDDAVIIEFKVRKKRENSLEETLESALAQIKEMQYEAGLIAKGFPAERIRKYGFAFEGKQVLIG